MTRPTDPRPAPLDDGVTHEALDGPLHNPETAHEHSDVNVRAVIYFLAGLSAVCVVAAAAMWGLFVLLEGQAARVDPALSPLATPAGQLPPEPRLLTDEPAVLEKQRAQERQLLGKGEWVDQKAGVARIPIEEAKKLLLEQGLPARAGEPIDARVGTRAASMSDASSGRHAVVAGRAEGRKDGTSEGRKDGTSEGRKDGTPESRKGGTSEERKDGTPESRKGGTPE
jgi:hypothetical protein